MVAHDEELGRPTEDPSPAPIGSAPLLVSVVAAGVSVVPAGKVAILENEGHATPSSQHVTYP